MSVNDAVSPCTGPRPCRRQKKGRLPLLAPVSFHCHAASDGPLPDPRTLDVEANSSCVIVMRFPDPSAILWDCSICIPTDSDLKQSASGTTLFGLQFLTPL